MPASDNQLLLPLVTAWLSKVEAALSYKKTHFQQDADDCMKFLSGPYDFMYGEKYASSDMNAMRWQGADMPDGNVIPTPGFRMTLNRVAELVQLFGPVLYHRNPIRQVNPRKLPKLPMDLLVPPMPPPNPMMDPMQQQMQAQMLLMQQQMVEQQMAMARSVDEGRATLLQEYLNYTPNELDLKGHMRLAIQEALIKGAGVVWTELYQPRHGGPKLVSSFQESIDGFIMDSDMEQLRDIQWCGRLCIHPVWEVEQEYGLPRGTLKGNLESFNSQFGSINSFVKRYERATGHSNDLLGYWKIYSKMGMGARLAGTPGEVATQLEALGDYVYLVIAPGHDYPLNLPLDVAMQPGELQQRVQWPVPFWRDNAWPFTLISFHQVPRKIWPMSHLKPAMGELQFLNWAYSYLASKIAVTSRDFIAVLKSAGEEIKDRIRNGPNLTVLELASAGGIKDIREIIQFLQHPEMNKDIWQVIQAVENNFERRTGLTELMYAQSSRQMRSAQEAAMKGDALRVRPDDMANQVEDAATAMARKEALATRWFITGQDVLPLMGPQGAQLWDQLVVSSDPATVMEYQYRVEAGSARKPNKARDEENIQQASQMFVPIFAQAAAVGQVEPFNAFVDDWCKATDTQDPERYHLQPPPPPPMPVGPDGTPVPPGPEAPQ